MTPFWIHFGSQNHRKLGSKTKPKKGCKTFTRRPANTCEPPPWVPLESINPSIPWTRDDRTLEHSTSCREGTVADIYIYIYIYMGMSRLLKHYILIQIQQPAGGAQSFSRGAKMELKMVPRWCHACFQNQTITQVYVMKLS